MPIFRGATENGPRCQKQNRNICAYAAPILHGVGMADEARQAAEQHRLASQNQAANRAQVEAWFTLVVHRLAAEFVASARQLGVKPAKRKFGAITDPKYFAVNIAVTSRSQYGDPSSNTWSIRVKANGSWDFDPASLQGRSRPYFPESLPPDADAQIRNSFTGALNRRAEGRPEPHQK
jgi:hypothetical protein